MSVPARHVLLFDGDCRFCVASTRRLLRWARPGSVQAFSFREPGMLGDGGRFPQFSAAQCERAMQLITPSRRILSGAAAAFAVLATRPLFRPLNWLYQVPGMRQLFDLVYRLFARNRFRLAGRVSEKESQCHGNSCRVRGHEQ